MIKIQYSGEALRQLSEELQAALPLFTRIAKLSRETDASGKIVLAEGLPVPVAPYLLLRGVGPATQATAEGVVAAHVRSLDPARAAKAAELVTEGVVRIAAQVPDWDSVERIKTVAGMWPAIAASATPAQLAAKDLYLFVRDTVPAKLAALASAAAIAAVDPALADPFGDGTPWPT